MKQSITLPKDYLRIKQQKGSAIFFTIIAIITYFINHKIGLIFICINWMSIFGLLHSYKNRLKILIWYLNSDIRLNNNFLKFEITTDIIDSNPCLSELYFSFIKKSGAVTLIKFIAFILALSSLWYTLNIFEATTWIRVLILVLGVIIFNPHTSRPNTSVIAVMLPTIKYIYYKVSLSNMGFSDNPIGDNEAFNFFK